MAGTDTKEAGRGMRTVCCDPPEAADASSYFPLSERAITRPERGCSITAPMKVVMLFWIQVSDASYLQVHSITRVSSFFLQILRNRQPPFGPDPLRFFGSRVECTALHHTQSARDLW